MVYHIESKPEIAASASAEGELPRGVQGGLQGDDACIQRRDQHSGPSHPCGQLHLVRVAFCI